MIKKTTLGFEKNADLGFLGNTLLHKVYLATYICIILFIGGVQLLCMGIMGQYLAKTYLEVKNRPHFIISETNDKDAKRIG